MTGHLPPDTQQRPSGADHGEAIVTGHIVCAECGYDLHGLHSDGKCPECGEPIRNSIAATGPESLWLVAICSGVRALLVAHCGLLLSAVMICSLPVGIACFIILALGSALEMSVRSPTAPVAEWRCTWPARFIGSGIVTCIVAGVVGGTFHLLGQFLALVGTAFMVAGLVLLWFLIAEVMRRGLSRSAARLARIVARLTIAASAIGMVDLAIFLIVAGSPAGGPTWLKQVLPAVTAATGALWLVASILAIIGLEIGLRALTRAQHAARAREEHVRAQQSAHADRAAN